MKRILLILGVGFIGGVALVAWLLITSPVESLRTRVAIGIDRSESGRTIGLEAVDLPVPSELPAPLVLAILMSEDQRFAVHRGIDFRELVSSVRQSLFNGAALRGASTISQQLARSAFLSNERSVSRKLVEALYSVQLERRFSKAQILSLYLQAVHWGPGVHGLFEASRTYFQKHPSGLTLEESIVLASLLPNPDRRGAAFLDESWGGALWPAVVQRTAQLHWVLLRLERRGRGIWETGDAVLALPFAEILAERPAPAELNAIAARTNRSLAVIVELLHGAATARAQPAGL